MRFLFLFVILILASCSAPRQIHYPAERMDRPYAWKNQPLQKAKKGLIIIDPGHGGEDHGTKSLAKPVYLEKYLNLTTAKFLATYLEQMGYQTLMTRNDDTFIPLKERAKFANERRPLLFVSVHYNSAPSAEAQGVEIFYFKSEKDSVRTKDSKALASSILRQVLDNTQASSRGVKQGNFAVIRETDMPAVLVEGGFLSNQEELQNLKDPSYLRKVAWGIAEGINTYVLGAS